MNSYYKKNLRKNFLLYLIPFVIVETFGVISILRLLELIPMGSAWVALVVFIIDLISLFCIISLDEDADYWYRGAEGEYIVRNLLKKLPSDYITLENVIIEKKRGNIDFIVVGPHGIALIDAKASIGRFTYYAKTLYRYGIATPYIWQIESHVKELGRLLHQKKIYHPGLQAYLAFTSPYAYNISDAKPLPGTNIVALKAERINNNILTPRGTDLNSGQIKRIVELLREYQAK